jgi:hypothetical protein
MTLLRPIGFAGQADGRNDWSFIGLAQNKSNCKIPLQLLESLVFSQAFCIRIPLASH